MVKLQEKVVMGRFGAPHGVRGQIKLQSFTEYPEDLFNYGPLFVSSGRNKQWREVEIENARFTGKHFVVTVKGLDDRDQAALMTNSEVAVNRSEMPQADGDDVYWHDLQGLMVISQYGAKTQCLGKIKTLMETGANDVLVVVPTEDSVDDQERLLPYIDSVVLEVNTDEGNILVDWDPAF